MYVLTDVVLKSGTLNRQSYKGKTQLCKLSLFSLSLSLSLSLRLPPFTQHFVFFSHSFEREPSLWEHLRVTICQEVVVNLVSDTSVKLRVVIMYCVPILLSLNEGFYLGG